MVKTEQLTGEEDASDVEEAAVVVEAVEDAVEDEKAATEGERPEETDVPMTIDGLKDEFFDGIHRVRDAGVGPFKETATKILRRGLSGVRSFLEDLEGNKKKGGD